MEGTTELAGVDIRKELQVSQL
ncbi:uncharacterized protein G2W53_009551 [Senna tora]|uniref:Uncharacterized protein n=1 Tax=Senna tora TaxID=362788 RepID=A0A835CCS3_9FABA|nr:uncharacterized protein G2W53_009551 [Senna tora]